MFQPTNHDAPTLRRWAVEAEVYPRTLSRFLRGEPTRALSQRRILRAAAVLGLSVPGGRRKQATLPVG
jgi:hypothetical protein